jgi:hypothetical protein
MATIPRFTQPAMYLDEPEALALIATDMPLLTDDFAPVENYMAANW